MNLMATLSLLVLSAIALQLTVAESGLSTTPLWPQPTDYSLGEGLVTLNSAFSFVFSGSSESKLLNRALDRYTALVKSKNGKSGSNAGDLSTCSVSVKTILPMQEERDSLEVDMDESYHLSISDSSSNPTCSIKANTVWGALHAMETFTQLLVSQAGIASMGYAPVSINDKPRFTHRGLLIDSSRHYLPMDVLKTMVGTLPMSKFNVFHWHIIDAIAFPLDTPSSPNMVKGAYAPYLTYSVDDVKELVDYAADRGVRVLMEIDGPGHAWSWGRGYPEILSDCAKRYFYNPNDFALNPTIDKTYEVLEGIMKDVVNAANSKYFHLGGDEVVYGCWAQDDSIRAYMKENGFEGDYKKLLAMYTERADALAISMGQTPVHWEDTFIAGVRPDKKVIFDVWTNSSQIKSVTQEGYRVIAAPSDYWYLNYCSPLQCWNTIYTYEPTSDLSPEEAALVIGGEASMWGEQTDSTNIVQKIWPNAAAAGERLWSPQMTNSTIIVDVDDGPAEAILADAQIRLETFRCRMNARGFAAGPLSPGFCPQMLV